MLKKLTRQFWIREDKQIDNENTLPEEGDSK